MEKTYAQAYSEFTGLPYRDMVRFAWKYDHILRCDWHFRKGRWYPDWNLRTLGMLQEVGRELDAGLTEREAWLQLADRYGVDPNQKGDGPFSEYREKLRAAKRNPQRPDSPL